MARVAKSKLQEYMDNLSKRLGFPVTQSQLAKATGIGQPTISAWASQKNLTQIDLKVLFALADYFGLDSPWDLLVIVEEKDDDDTEWDAPPTLSFDLRSTQRRGHYHF